MPGLYAQTMLTEQQNGHWPRKIITLMLHYNTLSSNVARGLHKRNYTFCNDDLMLASCHPNAIMFMNIVSAAPPFQNDMAAAVMVTAAAVQQTLTNAVQAALLDNKAIWVKYGSSEEFSHSIILLTGINDPVEPLEAWASGTNPFLFHKCVLDADALGENRDRPRPSRQDASNALADLISNRHAARKVAWDKLSRSGTAYAVASLAEVKIYVHVEDMANILGFAPRIRERMEYAGYFRALAYETRPGHRICCHCQALLARGGREASKKWVHCDGCKRRYCADCKKAFLRRVNDPCICGVGTMEAGTG